MPMLFSEGVVTGRISLDQFVDLTSPNAARLFGLYPRKGVIALGSDADLAPGIRASAHRRRRPMRSRADYSVYDGWDVQGWPRIVSSAARCCWPTARSSPTPARASGSAAAQTDESGGGGPAGS